MQAPFKVGTKCIMLHLGFHVTTVAEVVVGVCKGSQRKSKPKLPGLCGEGKQMVQVTQILWPSTHVM
jgi:hypothetical protein